MNPITANFAFTGNLQTYTVTVTGTYDLSGFGAAGGAGRNGTNLGGSGAAIGGIFNLTAGQTLNIIVGGTGTGTNNAGGGGGFTQIYTGSGNNITPLLIAGGGGGGGGLVNSPGGNATVGAPGPGTGGAGGAADGGGAGATSNGGTVILPGINATFGGGQTAAGGAAGGSSTAGATGGYGGGGGGGGDGGGGGGFTGGAGGGNGGTSYISNTGVQNFAETMAGANVSRGNGSVTIRFVAAAPCYVTGTCIRTLRGRTVADVPVERLRVGDLALTTSGKPRPIRWIGTRTYPGLSAAKHDRPVRIRAGALAEDVPARDLLVSPDHCLWLDGLLVAAGHLVNGTSITRGEAVADLTYWHVELDSHDLLLAENTPAESFLAMPGVRVGFDGPVTLDAAIGPVPYAQRTECGPALDALRERLTLRVGLSIEPTCFGTVRAWMDRCDGRRVAGWAQDAAHPDGPVCLDIVVDGAVVAMTLAEEYRADIAAAGVGDGCHGFDVDLDEPLAPGIPHTVEVRRSADGLRVCAMEVDAAGAWTPLLAA